MVLLGAFSAHSASTATVTSAGSNRSRARSSIIPSVIAVLAMGVTQMIWATVSRAASLGAPSTPRSLTTTLAPRAARPKAWARPSPWPAPVTMATRPSNRTVMVKPSYQCRLAASKAASLCILAMEATYPTTGRHPWRLIDHRPHPAALLDHGQPPKGRHRRHRLAPLGRATGETEVNTVFGAADAARCNSPLGQGRAVVGAAFVDDDALAIAVDQQDAVLARRESPAIAIFEAFALFEGNERHNNPVRDGWWHSQYSRPQTRADTRENPRH